MRPRPGPRPQDPSIAPCGGHFFVTIYVPVICTGCCRHPLRKPLNYYSLLRVCQCVTEQLTCARVCQCPSVCECVCVPACYLTSALINKHGYSIRQQLIMQVDHSFNHDLTGVETETGAMTEQQLPQSGK